MWLWCHKNITHVIRIYRIRKDGGGGGSSSCWKKKTDVMSKFTVPPPPCLNLWSGPRSSNHARNRSQRIDCTNRYDMIFGVRNIWWIDEFWAISTSMINKSLKLGVKDSLGGWHYIPLIPLVLCHVMHRVLGNAIAKRGTSAKDIWPHLTSFEIVTNCKQKDEWHAFSFWDTWQLLYKRISFVQTKSTNFFILFGIFIHFFPFISWQKWFPSIKKSLQKLIKINDSKCQGKSGDKSLKSVSNVVKEVKTAKTKKKKLSKISKRPKEAPKLEKAGHKSDKKLAHKQTKRRENSNYKWKKKKAP